MVILGEQVVSSEQAVSGGKVVLGGLICELFSFMDLMFAWVGFQGCCVDPGEVAMPLCWPGRKDGTGMLAWARL